MTGIVALPLEYKHVEDAANVICDAFLTRKEPTQYALQNQNNDAFKYSVLYYLTNLIEANTCFVAVDTQNNNKVVGVVVNHDYTFKVSKEFGNNFKRIANKHNQMNIYKLNYKIGQELRIPFIKAIKNNQELNQKRFGDILYIYMVAIHKDYGKKGIVTNLVKTSIENAKKLNYKLVFVETSNLWSKRCFMKNSFQVFNAIKYKNWEYPKGSNKYPMKAAAKQTGFNYISLLINNLSSLKSKL